MTAILEAAIRILADAGPDLADATTTRIAELAGVSVGTLYQYFPNRDALFTAVLADHLEHAIVAVERACEATAALSPREAIPIVVRAFLAAKGERAETARVIDRAFGTGKLDDRPIVTAASRRAEVALARMLSNGAEPTADTLARTHLACAALEGMVRSAVSEDPLRLRDPAWVDRVVAISLAALPA